GRYLKDEPVEARPPSSWYRLSKLVRRNKTALTVSAVVAAAVLLGTTVAVWQAKRASDSGAKRITDQADADAKLAKAIDDERRQFALDRAIEAAFGADLEKAHHAIVPAPKGGGA